jgi:hypothetical protein
VGLLNPGGPIAQFKRNRCSISPVEVILLSGVRIYVQSSQWDANDYYVEVGIAIEEIVGPKPSVTRWYVRKRCEDESQNDRNISLSVLKQAIDFFSDILTVNDLTLYLERTPHTLVGLQYELFSNT